MAIRTEDPCRRLLAVVPFVRLEEWCRAAGIPVPMLGGSSAMAEALIESRNFPFTAKGILARMSAHELGLACRELGGMGGSLDRARLEERILGLLSPEAAPAGDAPPAPALPVGAWLEGRRARATIEAAAEHRARRRRDSNWFRAAVWGSFFAAISWIGVFAHESDVLLLGAGVTALAFTIYRCTLGLPAAFGLAALEIAARLGLIGCGPAPVFTLVMVCFAELLCAAAMSVDADSVRNSETTLGLREHVNAPPPATPAVEEDGSPPAETRTGEPQSVLHPPSERR